MQRGIRILRSKRTLLASLVVIGTALGALTVATSSAAAQGSAAASPPTVLHGSAAPKAPAGTARVGALAAGHQLTVEVTLNLRNQAGLTALLGGLANPSSRYFHDFLTPAQFTANFGPTDAQVAQVESALRAAGLTPGLVSSDHLSIPVTASAARLDHAFGITLATYREPGGRAAYANTTAPQVAASIAPLVQGVIGLNDLYQARNHAQPVPAGGPKGLAAFRSAARAASPASASAPAAVGPQPCAPANNDPYGAPENLFAEYYGLSQLYSLGDEGAGQKIALLELEPNLTSDIQAFTSCYGIADTINYTHVDGGAGSGAGSGEAALDIELAAALAPKATIDVYQAPNSSGMGPGTGVYDIFKAFVTSNTEKTMSTSWGLCEIEGSQSDLQAQETLFQEANAQGQTILAAAGDSGATGCFIDGVDSTKTVSAGFPASAPYVVGVGGTAIAPYSASAFNSGNINNWSQIVWNESNPFPNDNLGLPPGGAGGGGTSGWCMPSYQDQAAIPGLINSFSSVPPPTYSACNPGAPSAYPDTTSYFRETPDVSANADPYWVPYGIYWSGFTSRLNTPWGGVGGTSAAAPLWAAIAALTDASPYCSGYNSGPAGVLPQDLYATVAGNHSYVYGSQPEMLKDIKPFPSVYDPNSGTQMTVPTNNDYTPSGDTSGDYPVTTGGYDLATGLGTPLVAGLSGGTTSTYDPGYTALMCRHLSRKNLAVTAVSPSSGKANTATKVTITGTGFLTVPGAVHIRVFQGSTSLALFTNPSCTTTACTVTLPALSAQTVDLRVSVEDSPYTAAVTADHYTYANAPAISSISPTSGTHSGGTKVTITGSNFIGVKSVTFAGKAGTNISVSGTSTLTVSTPSGTTGAKVTVVVNAAGGTSNTVSYTYT